MPATDGRKGSRLPAILRWRAEVSHEPASDDRADAVLHALLRPAGCRPRQAPFPSTGSSMMPLALAVLLALLVPAVVTAAPEGELTWAVHVSLAPSWFDPAETTGIITPFMF